jgi:hypothetical protein
MGVPKLRSFVTQGSFGVTETYPSRRSANEGFEKVHLVFDGPSFGYWLWKEAKLKHGMPRRLSQG